MLGAHLSFGIADGLPLCAGSNLIRVAKGQPEFILARKF
jgi:hypothetical protein